MEKYNGWTNRETWLVTVRFENALDPVVEDILVNNTDTVNSREEWIRFASEALEEYFAEYVSEFLGAHETSQFFAVSSVNGAGIIADLLFGAVARINWYEIAEHMADKFYTETKEDNDNA